jgi:hypothetical protein
LKRLENEKGPVATDNSEKANKGMGRGEIALVVKLHSVAWFIFPKKEGKIDTVFFGLFYNGLFYRHRFIL